MGLSLCSGDMLLEALVACAGVTLSSVATAIGIELRDATVRAEGELDFSGTLAVSKETPVGFQRIDLFFDLDTDASEEQLATLIRLTERYCVVYQTLRQPPEIHVSANRVRTSPPNPLPQKGGGARGAASTVTAMVPPLLVGEGARG